jgi:hypothetical protein
MRWIGREFGFFAGLLSVALLGGLAFAQSQNTSAQNTSGQNAYGLSDLKPYDGAKVAAPAGNDLDRLVRSEKTPPNGTPHKNFGDPVFTIHAVGGVMIDSTIRR